MAKDNGFFFDKDRNKDKKKIEDSKNNKQNKKANEEEIDKEKTDSEVIAKDEMSAELQLDSFSEEEIIEEMLTEEQKEILRLKEEIEKYKQNEKKFNFQKALLVKKEKSVNEREEEVEERLEELNKKENEIRKKADIEKQEYIKEFEELKEREILKYKEDVKNLRDKSIEFNILQNDLEGRKFKEERLVKENESLKGKLIELEEFKYKYESNKDYITPEAVQKLRDNIELLEDKVTKFKKENNRMQELEKKEAFIEEELERLKLDNEILRNKLSRYKRRLDELQNIEKEKGTGEDSTCEIFRSVILEEEDHVQNQGELINYFGDNKAIKSFMDFAKEAGFEYEEKTVRGFISAVKSSKFTILKGFSGTGKSSLPELFSMFIGAECEVIPVQPNWKTKQDIMGFYNYFTHKFEPAEITKILIRANVNREKIFFIVLDEMNLARVEYYFSEFNSKLWMPKDKKFIELFSGKIGYDEKVSKYIEDNKVFIPDNVYFIGTINEDDSVSPISDKIYDRAQVIDFITKPNKGRGGSLDNAQAIAFRMRYKPVKASSFEVEESENTVIDDMIYKVNEIIREEFNRNLAYRAMNQINNFVNIYVKSEGMEHDALDLQLVSKFLPKIKGAYTSSYDEKIKTLDKTIQDMFKEKYKSLKESELKNLQIVKQLALLIKEFEG